MTDLFRGYDLTTVADKVARADYERHRTEALSRGFDSGDMPEWDTLDGLAKLNIKNALLPIITQVLEALESDEVKPTEAKRMWEYGYHSFENAGDGTKYENHIDQHDVATCTVWVLHMNLHPLVKDAVLERMAVMPETTGEYTYGDSWTEWGEPTTDDTDRHMAIYFDATPRRAGEIGTYLANAATFAGMKALGGADAEIPPFAVSTSGDYAEQLEVPA